MSEVVSIEGRTYSFRILGIEYDDIIDKGYPPMKTDRLLLAASLNMKEEDVSKLDRPTRARLSMEFSRLHGPKPLDPLKSEKSSPSQKPLN